ncbi:MAG: SH3 domain-containing protein, partial [Eubacteriales bacterium]|nr:SH3 domain-containing protein [Eubacteriales bacterium]
DVGLLIFERDGTRILVMVDRPYHIDSWTAVPVGEKAILQNRDVYIEYESQRNAFAIIYPVSDVESESFGVRLRYNYEMETTLCQLVDYQHTNTDTGEGIVIDGEGGELEASQDWYHVTVYKTGEEPKTEVDAALIPPYLDYIDAEAFPKTAEECRAAVGYTVPEGYGVLCGVHLRAKTSSHSANLGLYHEGTLVQVLGEEPGNPYHWYHVRIGSQEGYMSGIYVNYPGSECAMHPLSQYLPLPVAKAKKDIALKKGTGWFDGTVATLEAGTQMHVLGTRGDWLHVMVPQEEKPGWLMDINGTDGYVKAGDVVQAATSLQLDWLEP